MHDPTRPAPPRTPASLHIRPAAPRDAAEFKRDSNGVGVV